MFSHRKKKFKLTHVNSEYVNAINALYRESTNSHNIANQSRIPYFLWNKCVQYMFHVHLFSILFSIFALFGSDFSFILILWFYNRFAHICLFYRSIQCQYCASGVYEFIYHVICICYIKIENKKSIVKTLERYDARIAWDYK